MIYNSLGHTGVKLSQIGFGGSPLGGVFGSVEEDESVRAVHLALDRGINYFDVAPFYGITRAETAMGIALRGIPRDRYFISTKVGRYGAEEFDFSADRVARSVDESLARLGVGHIDIILCHDIEYGSIDQVVNETIPALQKIRESGKVRFIGVSGLPLKIFHSVLDMTKLDVVLSYCHHTLNDSSLSTHIPYLKEKQIGIINASPFAMGLLTENVLPEWHPAPESLRRKVREASAHCRKRGAELAQLALQFGVSNPDIATTLIGMSTQEEVLKNLLWIEQPMDRQLLDEVLAIFEPVHNLSWTTGSSENN